MYEQNYTNEIYIAMNFRINELLGVNFLFSNFAASDINCYK